MASNVHKPKFHPRAQVQGTIRWSCVYCARVNEHALHPTRFKTKCRSCDKYTWWGLVAHIPAGSSTRVVKDSTIPTWAGDEYSFDPIKFDPMPQAVFFPDKLLKQRGRISMILIHENVYVTDDGIPVSPDESTEVLSDEDVS